MKDPKKTPFRVGLADFVSVAALFVVGWLGDLTNRSLLGDEVTTSQATDLILLLAVILPLLVRRRFPLSVLVWTTAAFLWTRVADVPEGTATAIAMFVALFSAGAYSRHRWRDLIRGASLMASFGVLLWAILTHSGGMPGNVVLAQVFTLVINLAFYAAAWLMGDIWRKRVDDQVELARRAEALEEQRHQLAVQAVANERLRIAQELHDIVGHHVSVMGVQAGAARRSLDSDPGESVRLLESIEESGRSAVTEMGRLVGFLRAGENGAVTPPPPTLAELDHLIDSSRGAGLEVEMHRIGRPRPTDTTTELSAYRVVQEALTNALKHGGEGGTSVEVAYLTDHLSLRIRNPLAPGRAEGVNGRGLAGMAERMTLVGGKLTTGSVLDGTFEVHAMIPYGSDT